MPRTKGAPSPGLSQRIREERKKLGWSQVQLSKLSGVGRKYICDIEAGRHNPTMATVKRLCDALGITEMHLSEFVITAGQQNSEVVNLHQIENLIRQANDNLSLAMQLLEKRR